MRIFESFMNMKTGKMLSYLFEEHPEVLLNFKKHFYLRSIAEAFGKIISFNCDELRGKKYTDERLALVDDLFNMLQEEQDPEINANIAYVIGSILKKGASITDNGPLLLRLASGLYIPGLVEKMQVENK